MTETKTTKKAPVKKDAPKKEVKKAAPKADVFAVIKTGGKQYPVEVGRTYDFEKLEGDEGKSIDFSEVLLVADGTSVKIGKPNVEGAKVSGKIVKQFKDDKVLVVKYKKRKRILSTVGHRQTKTKVEITKIA